MHKRTSAYFFLSRAFFAIATGITLYLSAEAMQPGQLAGCGDNGGCAEVLTSQWSRLFGLPVSFFGLLTYTAMMWLSRAFVSHSRSYAGGLATGVLLTIVTAAIGFSWLQVYVLKEICGLCISAHAAALCGAGFLWLAARHRTPERIEQDNLTVRRHWATVACTVACAGGVISAGLAINPLPAGKSRSVAASRSAPAAGAVEDTVELHGGKFSFRLKDLPSLGNPKANGCAVLISDYTCPHCRDFYAMLASHPPAQGVLVVPGHRSAEGRALQELMLTLYHADRKAWQTITGKLLRAEIQPVLEPLAAAIEQLVPRERLSTTRRGLGAELDKLLDSARALIEANRAFVPEGNLPQLMAGGHILVGASSQEEIRAFFSQPPSHAVAGQSGPVPPLPPALVAKESIVDLGPVAAGTQTPVQISLTNQGDTLSRLDWIDLPAGFTIKKSSHDELMPGETALIDLLLDTPSTGGAFSSQVDFHSGPQSPPISVVVRGEASLPAAN